MNATPSSFWCENSRRERAETIDPSLSACGADKHAAIELGLAVLHAAAKPGAVFSHQEIALWCGCTRDAIYLIEKAALKKLGNKLRFGSAAKLAREMVA